MNGKQADGFALRIGRIVKGVNLTCLAVASFSTQAMVPDSLWFSSVEEEVVWSMEVVEVCNNTDLGELVVHSSVDGDSVHWSLEVPASVTGLEALNGSGLEQAIIPIGTVTNASISAKEITITAWSNASLERNLSIEVAPTIEVVLGPLAPSDTICHDEQVFALVGTTVHNVEVKWTAESEGNVQGAVDGFGPVIYDQLTNTSGQLGTVTYHLYTPFEACPADTLDYPVVVVPAFELLAVTDSIVGCPGEVVPISSYGLQVPEMQYGWAVDGDYIGLDAQGTGYLDSLVLGNELDVQATATVHLTAGIAACMDQTPMHLTVHPAPAFDLTATSSTACSGAPIDAELTANLDSLSLHWESAAQAATTGHSAGNAMHAATFTDTLYNGGLTPDTVHYAVWVTDYICPVDTAVFDVAVAPALALPQQPDLRLCPGMSPEWVDVDLGIAGVTYAWEAEGGEEIGLGDAGVGLLPDWVAGSTSDSAPDSAQVVVVADFEGCLDSTAFEVRVDPMPSVQVVGFDALVCNDAPLDWGVAASLDTAVVIWAPLDLGTVQGQTASSGTLLADTLNNPSDVLASATYMLWAEGAFCPSDTLVQTVTVLPDYTLPALDSAHWCNGDAAEVAGLELSVSGGNYAWTVDNVVVGLPATGTGNAITWNANNGTDEALTAVLQVTAAVGECPSVEAAYVVVVHPTPVLSATVSPNDGLDCQLETGFIEGEASTGTGLYTWEGPSVLETDGTWAEVGEAGTYTMSFVDDETGCNSAAYVVVLPAAPAVIEQVTWDTLICPGASDGWVSVFAADSSELIYAWEPPVGFGAAAEGIGAGTYKVWVTNASNCMDSAVIEVVDIDSIQAHLVDVGYAVCGQPNGYMQAEASGGWGELTLQWAEGSQPDPWIWGVGEGAHVLEITDANGCTADVSFELECLSEIPVGAVQLVTPNGDGHNDVWVVEDLYLYPNHAVQVFNRWGRLVYEAAPYLNDWAGTWETGNGQPLPSGTYYYLFDPREAWAPKFRGFIELMNEVP